MRQLLVEESEEAAVVVVQVFHQLVWVARAERVGGQALARITTSGVAEQCGAAEDKEWGLINKVENCEDPGNGGEESK